MWLNERVQNVLTSLAYYPERLGTNYNAAILKFRRAAHPFGLKLKGGDFFTASKRHRKEYGLLKEATRYGNS
jgi:hypothetical protein